MEEEFNQPSGTGEAHRGGGPKIIVESVAALKGLPENAGRRIRVRKGRYEVDVPLLVPDGASLEGEGEMMLGDDHLPLKFKSGTETTITALAGLRAIF